AWGEPEELVAYLLPNAVTIRGSTSTDVASLWHKAKMRLCFCAQEEIWRLVLAQVREIDRVAPNIGQWLLAPCQIRRLAGITPYCPEGNRYCGVPVWEVTGHDYPPRII
ncbi:MAG: FAD-dependent thymidylate synthase, partial [bacterium]|nr:FAD-dependent thymidylate synthase [bacterium]